MNKTKIEWAQNPDGTLGYTWNPITGCLNHINGMCKGGNFPCYACRLANTRLKERYLANTNLVGGYLLARGALKEGAIPPRLDPFYPRFWEDKIREFDHLFAINERNYLRRLPKKSKGIFTCDMSDLFGIGIPERWTREVLTVIEQADMHRFYLLTKQPWNLIKFSPFPENAWVGVTATGYQMFIDACGSLGALKHEGKIKTAFVSIEPLLSWDSTDAGSFILSWLMMGGIDQVIIGAQTKPYKPPKIEWVREIVEACIKAGIPVFLKNNLKPLLKLHTNENVFWADLRDKAGFEDLHLELRQEMQGALDAGEPHKLPLAGSNPAPATNN
ncbi:hypothetical protein LCGC14_0787860 [marine sediment metagenome]|uniref:DUF5131 family protein n=1 Tax=marine sediment metagenome TaxID=412755 RepID=A0A0F9QDD7_9ZZZZ